MSSKLGRPNKDHIGSPQFGVEPTQAVSVRYVVTNPYPYQSRVSSFQVPNSPLYQNLISNHK